MFTLSPRVRRVALWPALVLILICAPSAWAQTPSVYLAGYPLLRQQRLLTCEASAASMGTRARISESQIMAIMARNANPNRGFRGNPDGFQGKSLVDYGVYANPLRAALLRYGYGSDVLTYATDQTLRSYLNRGWPLVVWITYGLQPGQARMGQAGGEPFILVTHEHAFLAVGYDRGSIIGNDPWTAKIVRYGWGRFNRSWALFGNMALAIQPCTAPAPVGEIRARAVTDGSVTWDWDAVRNAVRYHLVVLRSGAGNAPVYQGDQQSTHFSFAAPSPGHGYVLQVRAVAACGISSPVTGAWYWTTPTSTPTVTPTPAAEATVSVAPTTTGSVTATPTGTPRPL